MLVAGTGSHERPRKGPDPLVHNSPAGSVSPGHELSSGSGVDAASFRELMSAFPSGVAVVTTLDLDGSPRGLTCTSLCSVSASPPMLLVCVHRGSGSLAAVRRRGAFAVNLLHSEGRAAAEAFAHPDGWRFEGTPWEGTAGRSLPRLTKHAHATAECAVVRTFDAGDHTVVLGQVEEIQMDGRPPLMYGLRHYAAWTG